MTSKSNLERESKQILIEEINKEESKFSIRKSKNRINELHYSLKYRKPDTDNYDFGKKFEKIKKEDIFNLGEDNLLTQMKKMKEMEEKRLEEEEEEEEGNDISDSIASSYYNDLEDIDLSNELENKGDVMNKKWMENSPKFKNRILDLSKSRRHAISATNLEMFDNISKNEKITKLNDRMRIVYENLRNNRKARKKKKRKKRNYFNFIGVDTTSIEEIEKKKKVYLYRMKEDIKYKINQGKYHLIEMENFKHFENAMNKFKLKDSFDPKKVKLYISLVQKYLLYYKGVLFGGIYDERLLIKRTDGNKKYQLEEAIPYDGAKPMYMIADLDDRETIKEIVLDTYNDIHK